MGLLYFGGTMKDKFVGRIVALRLDNNISELALSELVGLPEDTVKKIEAGAELPRKDFLKFLEAISTKMSVPYQYLITGKRPEEIPDLLKKTDEIIQIGLKIYSKLEAFDKEYRCKINKIKTISRKN